MKNTIKQNIMKYAVALGAMGVALPAMSVSLSLQPDSQQMGINGQAMVNVIVSDLGSGTQLAGFTFDLVYDPAVLSATSVTFGGGLGSSSQSFDLTSPGFANLFEVSFEDSSFFTGQASSFTLATLIFQGVDFGQSALSFENVSLTDSDANSLTFQASGGSITVPDAGSSFALSGLSLLGLLGFGAFTRRASLGQA